VATALGLAVLLALSLQLGGVLLTTALLVLPALAARRLCRRLATVPWLAVGLAEAAVTAGFAIAWSADLPPAQVAVALLGLVLAASWCWPPSWRA
jgi:zinc transport system permease protein